MVAPVEVRDAFLDGRGESRLQHHGVARGPRLELRNPVGIAATASLPTNAPPRKEISNLRVLSWLRNRGRRVGEFVEVLLLRRFVEAGDGRRAGGPARIGPPCRRTSRPGCREPSLFPRFDNFAEIVPSPSRNCAKFELRF